MTGPSASGSSATGPASGVVRVLGVDSGGSGLRVALAEAAPGEAPRTLGTVTSTEPVRTGARGIDPAHMLEQLLPAARALLAEAEDGGRADTESAGPPSSGPPSCGPAAPAGGLTCVCVGAAGMASLGDALRDELPGALASALGAPRVALAADGVTAYAGALGERPGAVVVAGTGVIAMGTDLRSWRRADGWGHLLGDCGSGAWIGRAGLEAAMRAYDGREGGSAALRERAEAAFGAPLARLPGLLYPRTDRPAVLASFAPEVARCAREGDRVARGVLAEAAREIAMGAAAVCPASPGAAVAVAGGLLRIGAPLRDPLERELSVRLPHARTTEAAGDPLEGALLIAARVAQGGCALPTDPDQLTLHGP